MAATLIQRSRSKRPGEKAVYHHVTGAGRTRVKRQFFGLSPADQDAVYRELGVRLEVNLRHEGSRGA